MPREAPVMRAVPCERELLMLFSLCERLSLPSSAIPTFGRHNCVSVTSAGRTASESLNASRRRRRPAAYGR